MLFSSLVEESAKDLNDFEKGFEYTRWSQECLREFASDAVAMVFSLRPDLFVETKTITLKSGAIQTLDEGCTKLNRVDGVLDENGNVTGLRAAKGFEDIDRWFFSKECLTPNLSGGGYTITSYKIDDEEEGRFIVNPPVPNGQTVEVQVQCVEMPDCESEEVPLDKRFHPILLEYIKYRALMIDDESATSFQRGQFHLSIFLNFLQSNKSAYDEINDERSSNVPATT